MMKSKRTNARWKWWWRAVSVVKSAWSSCRWPGFSTRLPWGITFFIKTACLLLLLVFKLFLFLHFVFYCVCVCLSVCTCMCLLACTPVIVWVNIMVCMWRSEDLSLPGMGLRSSGLYLLDILLALPLFHFNPAML